MTEGWQAGNLGILFFLFVSFFFFQQASLVSSFQARQEMEIPKHILCVCVCVCEMESHSVTQVGVQWCDLESLQPSQVNLILLPQPLK